MVDTLMEPGSGDQQSAQGSGHPDIVFIVSHGNVNSEYLPFYFLYLAGYLEKNGFLCRIFNEPIRDEAGYNRAAVEYLKRTTPKYVGLATFVTDFDQSLALADLIKKEAGIPVIVGNAHPSICPGDFIYPGSPFDIAVIGEGELTLGEILSRGTDRAGLDTIKGIAYLDGDRCTVTEKRGIMDLADCGMPAYHRIDLRRYAKPTKYIIRRLPASCAVIYTARGCPFKCGFCAANTVWQTNSCPEGRSFVRRRPIGVVMEELALLEKQYGFDFFYILDDTFGLSENDIIEFCDAYQKSGLTMLWAAETRVNSICFRNEALLQRIRDAGCIQLDFGVETGSPRLLKIIRKGITIEQVHAAFELCKKHHIRTFANILLNLPTETEDDIRLTDRLLKEIDPTIVSVGVTQPYPGTMFCETYIKKTLTKEDYKNLNRLVPSDEYRMAEHRVPLQKLLYYFQFRYGTYTPLEWSALKSDRRYWKKLVSSKRRFEYLWSFTKMMIVAPFLEYLQMQGRMRQQKMDDYTP
jgi:anaerobic magnesium-protoporphyrin IX monomethyl ester cyclase